MENQVQLFQNADFGKIRAIDIDGQPWFVGKDVAEILGYSNSRKAVSDHVDVEDKGVTKWDTLGGEQNLTIINESGLYSLILSSKLQKAKLFKRWITMDVIPSIRKHGAYMTENTLDKMLENPDLAIRLFTELKHERENALALKASITELEPKARYYDTILRSTNSVLTSIIAKDYGMSAINFNKLLHELKIQYKMDNTWVLYQQYADYGYMQSQTYPVNDYKSVVRTAWTQKGRLFLYNFLKQRGIVPTMEKNLVEQITIGQ